MPDPVQPPGRADFEAAFDPRAYLNEYFSGGIDDEDRFTAQFIARVLKNVPGGILAHEFGGGPALYSVAALAARAREIHFSDAVPASLEEVRRWLAGKPDAFDWKPYIRLALEAEGSPADEAAVQRREDEMRARLTRLMLCDAQSFQPLGPEEPVYDLVAANHCTDVAAASAEEWFQVIRNVSSLVKPGGWLIVTVTGGTRTYTVGSQKFACADLSADDVLLGLLQAGYNPATLSVAVHAVEGQREYSGIIAGAGQKLA